MSSQRAAADAPAMTSGVALQPWASSAVLGARRSLSGSARLDPCIGYVRLPFHRAPQPSGTAASDQASHLTRAHPTFSDGRPIL
jgi:hypothetical protein